MAARIPNNETERLQALRELNIVGSDPTPEFEAVIEAVRAIFQAPIALVSLVEDDYQWFKAKCGLDADSTPRDVSFCAHAIHGNDIFLVPDATLDDRFKDNALVVGGPQIRFYAGYPLAVDGVNRLGALCVIDTVPRQPTVEQLAQLRRLGVVVEGLIKAHRSQEELSASLELIRTEKKIAVSNGQLLEKVADVSGVGGWELDLQTSELTWTRRTHEIHDVPYDFIPTLDEALEFYPPRARPVITEAVSKAIESGGSWDLELPFLTAQGRHIWVHAVGSTLLEDGKAVRLVGAFEDITDRKLAEEGLRNAEAVQRTTLETLSEGILLIDHDGLIQSCNASAAEMFGLDRQALIGCNVAEIDVDIMTLNDDDDSISNPLVMASMFPEKVQQQEARLIKGPEGHRTWLRVNASSVDDNNELGLEGVVVSLMDITESRRQANTVSALFDNFPGGLVYWDEDMHLQVCNQEFSDLMKIPQEMIDQKLHLLEYMTYNAERGQYGEGEPSKLAKGRFDALEVDKPYMFERETPEGRVHEVRGSPLPDGGLIASFFDVTDRKKLEAEILANERIARRRSSELETILANMRQGVSVFDADGKLQLWNELYVEIFNKPEGEVKVGASLEELLLAEQARGEFQGDVDEHVRELKAQLAKAEVVRSTFKHPSGRIISAVHAPMPQGGWIGTHEDVTVRELAQEKITYAASHDTLTGLANRLLFNTELEKALERAQKNGTESTLILVDLDHFKPINDTYGHDAGDAVLKEVSVRFQDSVRSSDIVARLGGDEFAIILSNASPTLPATTEVIERLVKKIAAPIRIPGNCVTVGASIGVATVSDQCASINTPIKQADLALYEVKRSGRNGYRFYTQEVSDKLHA
ncbi:PAS-domain containing protein [Roseibium sp. CAU 1637]|uniref:PAS-domain containing protein n=1 Tax=Roseibium limicola TaxID=2816037 RepID=A0A939EQZ1_9HYPH|nr:PAS-domain containing protein [Roseibium limicola]MBO0346487.1 PAS-domain containing protein [Roseibium limicola]